MRRQDMLTRELGWNPDPMYDPPPPPPRMLQETLSTGGGGGSDPRIDREVALAAVRRDGLALARCSDELRQDRDLVRRTP